MQIDTLVFHLKRRILLIVHLLVPVFVSSCFIEDVSVVKGVRLASFGMLSRRTIQWNPSVFLMHMTQCMFIIEPVLFLQRSFPNCLFYHEVTQATAIHLIWPISYCGSIAEGWGFDYDS